MFRLTDVSFRIRLDLVAKCMAELQERSRGLMLVRFVFDKPFLDLELQPVGFVFVFNNVVYNIEDCPTDTSD